MCLGHIRNDISLYLLFCVFLRHYDTQKWFCVIFPPLKMYIFTRSSWKVAWGGQTKCHESEETNVNILSFFVLYFCEKNAVMKSNGVKSISCVYLRRVRKAMWTHRAPPNPGPSSLLLCKASQRRSSSSLREKLLQNLFFFEKFDVYLEKFIQIQIPPSYWLFSFLC